jgi:FkbM family methyltransferase
MSSFKTAMLNGLRFMLFRATALDRLLPSVTAGKSANSLVAKLPPNPGQYPAPCIRRATRNGIRYELDLSDFMEWCTYYGIAIEARDALYGLAKPGDVVVDVGANIGEVALNLASRVGTEGAVYAFEASPLVYQKLVRNLSLNRMSNISSFNLGLSDQPGVAKLEMPRGNRGGGSLLFGQTENPVSTVELVRLDDIWDFSKPRLHLIKLDVEGHESRVLAGAEKVIRRYRPVLFVELNDSNLRRHGSSAKELLHFVSSLGYKTSDAATGERLSPEQAFEARHLDFVATISQSASARN